MSVMIGTDLNELPYRIAGMAPGEHVHLAIVTEQPVSQDVMDQFAIDLRQSGIKLLSSVSYVDLEWEGYTKSAMYVSFEAPSPPASGEYAFLPMLIIAIAGLGVLGYLVWKAGDIAEDSAAAIVKKLPWILLILGGVWLASKQIKQTGGYHE